MDKVVYLLHDNTFRRTTNIETIFPDRIDDPAYSFDWKEIRKLSLKMGDTVTNEKIPNFDSLLKLVKEYPSKKLIFDVNYPPKGNILSKTLRDKLFESIVRNNLTDQVIFLNLKVPRKFKGNITDHINAKDAGRLISVNEIIAGNITFLNIPLGVPYSYIQSIQRYNQRVQTEANSHTRPIHLNVYVVSHPLFFSQVWLLGIDSVTTNCVEKMNAMSKPIWYMKRKYYIATVFPINALSAILLVFSVEKELHTIYSDIHQNALYSLPFEDSSFYDKLKRLTSKTENILKNLANETSVNYTKGIKDETFQSYYNTLEKKARLREAYKILCKHVAPQCVKFRQKQLKSLCGATSFSYFAEEEGNEVLVTISGHHVTLKDDGEICGLEIAIADKNGNTVQVPEFLATFLKLQLEKHDINLLEQFFEILDQEDQLLKKHDNLCLLSLIDVLRKEFEFASFEAIFPKIDLPVGYYLTLELQNIPHIKANDFADDLVLPGSMYFIVQLSKPLVCNQKSMEEILNTLEMQADISKFGKSKFCDLLMQGKSFSNKNDSIGFEFRHIHVKSIKKLGRIIEIIKAQILYNESILNEDHVSDYA
ncbi:hypothetical protein ROZALSC1DRAFT_30300 [Rozella allomycis CSF55]|uniref:GP-PDE domain-containing protein n=1 Tax=Rozella allomycis (strain CSF55) TaxID=988480 RepID=A0A4P9YFA9_ROZAC|nr:hypothetical protein ROZALSC1DRAFT_30300 [Rozella allomycis CSF55]